MYRLLIADDDMTARIHLRTLLDWNSLNFELVEDAVDGRDTLKKVDRHNPDIIILDMSMPVMDGLDVIKRLKEQDFRGKIIVLSCHDDFERVKEALKMGAIDYVLKHLLKPNSLIDSLNRAVELLEKEIRDGVERKKLKLISKQSITILKDSLIKSLINGGIQDKNEIKDRLARLDIEKEFTRFAVIVIEVDEMHKLKEKYSQGHLNTMMNSVQRIIEETACIGNNCICGCIEEGRYCIIMDFDNTRSYMIINNNMYEICSKILTNVNNFLNICVSAGISKIFNDLSSIKDCFTQAHLALDGKLYMGINKIIHFSDMENYNCMPEDIFNDYEYKIYEAVSTNSPMMKKCIEDIFTDIKAKNIKTEFIRLMGLELMQMASRMAKDFNISYNDVFNCEYLPYHNIMNMETIDEIKQWFMDICSNITSKLNNRRTGIKGIRPEIMKALDYIYKKHMKNITLQEIADYTSLSRTYFSFLFKQEMGESFVDYLNKYRIEKARRLLDSSDKKIFEVGFACGFDSYRHFTKKFKEITGLSPGEYKCSLKT